MRARISRTIAKRLFDHDVKTRGERKPQVTRVAVVGRDDGQRLDAVVARPFILDHLFDAAVAARLSEPDRAALRAGAFGA